MSKSDTSEDTLSRRVGRDGLFAQLDWSKYLIRHSSKWLDADIDIAKD